MGARRYEICLRVLSSISHGWAQRLRREISNPRAPVSCFVYFIKILKTTFLTIFWRYSVTFRRFPKILQTSKGLTNVSEHFPKIKQQGLYFRLYFSQILSLLFYESQVWHLSKESFCPLPRLCLFAWHVTWWMEWDWQAWRGCAGAAVRKPWRSWERHMNPLWLLWRLVLS